jgi:ribosomal protein S18 acetylase RimI-like enzyme
LYVDASGRAIAPVWTTAEEQCFVTASLWVLEENAIGRRFYEKFGFKPDGKIKPYPSSGRELQELRYIIGL